jgi:hypothetical protein
VRNAWDVSADHAELLRVGTLVALTDEDRSGVAGGGMA